MFAPDLAGPAENEKPDAVSHPTKPYSGPSFGMGIEGCPAISMTHHAANKYLTNAPWVGFRLVRQAEIPPAEERYRIWNNGVAMDR